MKLTTFSIDLAKNVFQVHGTDEHGKVFVKKQLRRDQMATFFVNLPPCRIGMQALWQRALLGAQAPGDGPHGTPDGTAVRQTVCQV